MLQFSRKVEYGLIALKHFAIGPRGAIFTAKEISDEYNIPYDLLAKVLQKLARAGVLVSLHGVRGGYTLRMKPEEISLATIIDIIDNEKPLITACGCEDTECCERFDICTIREPLGKIQREINTFFQNVTLQKIL
ncbi:MAG: Rrf2 family transcriptional regulator [Bacteroidetes bacterium]|nr:Rrf2 family transcriptional regulator [Bacteroidota bacterium]